MTKNANFLSRQQDDFARTAYAYGIQPAVCTLLAETFHKYLREAWQNGHRAGWFQAIKHSSQNLLTTNAN
jgi:hypothetical protein